MRAVRASARACACARARARAPTRASAPGFSLIELMVVLVIMGVVLGISAPQLASFNRGLRLNGAARQVQSFLEYGRVVALGQGREVRVLVEPDWRTMQILVEERPGSGRYVPAGVPGARYELAEGVSIDAILLDGRAAAAGRELRFELSPLFARSSVEVRIVGSRGATRRIHQAAGSGRVVIGG